MKVAKWENQIEARRELGSDLKVYQQSTAA